MPRPRFGLEVGKGVVNADREYIMSSIVLIMSVESPQSVRYVAHF